MLHSTNQLSGETVTIQMFHWACLFYCTMNTYAISTLENLKTTGITAVYKT